MHTYKINTIEFIDGAPHDCVVKGTAGYFNFEAFVDTSKGRLVGFATMFEDRYLNPDRSLTPKCQEDVNAAYYALETYCEKLKDIRNV